MIFYHMTANWQIIAIGIIQQVSFMGHNSGLDDN